MWVFALFVFGLINGAISFNPPCERDVNDACPMSLVLETSLPGTEDQLDKACYNLKQIKLCMIAYFKECKKEYYDEISLKESGMSKETLRLLKLTTDVCRKDSDIHRRFVQDMSCLKKVSDDINEDRNCDDIEIMKSSLVQAKRTDDFRRSDMDECQRVLSNMNCFLRRYNDECGSRAKDTAVVFIQRGGSLDDQCPEDVQSDVLKVFDLWKKQTGKEVYVRELFA